MFDIHGIHSTAVGIYTDEMGMFGGEMHVCVLSRTMSACLCFKKQKLSYLIFPAGNGNMLKLRFFQSRLLYENIMGNYRIPQQKIYKQKVLKVFFN